MHEKEEKIYREQVLDMIGDMVVRVREEEVVDVVRMRKKEGVGLARPITVEFKSEYDKWTVYILSVYSPFSDRIGLPLHNIHNPSPFTSIMDIFFVDLKFGHIHFYTL